MPPVMTKVTLAEMQKHPRGETGWCEDHGGFLVESSLGNVGLLAGIVTYDPYSVGPGGLLIQYLIEFPAVHTNSVPGYDSQVIVKRQMKPGAILTWFKGFPDGGGAGQLYSSLDSIAQVENRLATSLANLNQALSAGSYSAAPSPQAAAPTTPFTPGGGAMKHPTTFAFNTEHVKIWKAKDRNAKKPISDFPHKCPHCKGPAYVGAVIRVDCQAKCARSMQ